ncbi:Cell surface protein [Oopsacas minuta]|uniref:Cell surface protein n=1 Tax=Oopsacas minuta TaxID=111878 RepID=A0AAV7K404_9METZ|nr:Cell surface protein [Oopsacas minuta]
MAGASYQLNFLSQIQNARVELETNFSRLIQNINVFKSQLLEKLQEMENEHRIEVEKEEELRRLTQCLSSTVISSNLGNRISSITDQIQHLFSENNCKLLVLDWDLSTEQILLNNFSDYIPLYTGNSSSSSSCEEVQLSLEQKYKIISIPTNTSCLAGQGCGELDDPRGVGIDDDTDHIYVADYNNHCIVVFERDGSYLREFTHKRMVNPVGIYVSGSLDRVYITIFGRDAVHCYKLDGTFIKEITHYGTTSAFNNPTGITMDSSERIYVCDQGRDRVVVFTKHLVFITVLTSQLSNPRDVKAVGSEVAILHDGEYCVSFYTRGGMFLRRVVKKGNNKQKVGHPVCFCIDSDNNILITDSTHDCIKIYRNTGFHICNIGCRGNSEGEFMEPAGIALFDDNSIVTLCDRDDDQLQVFEL